ncbi:MAG: hypothetical protein CMH57_16180 [Myxococcales bacterium]|nr:hypothetical protein [Myxococcales bacterium]
MDYQPKAHRAQQLIRQGNHREAIPLLRELLDYTFVVDFEYDEWLRWLADAYKKQGNHTPAGYIYLYLHYFDNAHDCFELGRSRLDLALCHEVRRNNKKAADLYRAESHFVRAAINLELTNNMKEAVSAWETTRSNIHDGEDPYPYALATVNLALALRKAGEVNRVRDLFIEAITIIEGLADEWESFGFLDEALGAYHVLCLIGQIEQRFENLAEGYCNAIRLLREQGQTFRVFRYYAAICEYGENLGEDHAVATLHREAADYAVRTGTTYQSFYLKQAAEAYMRVAGRTREKGNFPELAENAYLAAIDAYNQMGDVASVERCYRALASLELEEERTERYQRIAAETRTITREPPEIYPPGRLLLTPPKLPKVWRNELLAWESGDEPIAVLKNIIWNLEYSDVSRRQALILVLYYQDLRNKDVDDDPELLQRIARTMAGLQSSASYKTLRRLVENRHASVRAQVMSAAGSMQNAKGFILLEMGLVDASEEVQRAAVEGLKTHNYPEAFDHLVRIFQNHSRPDVRRVVLEALGKIGNFEAAEFLWSLLRSEAEDEQERAIRDAAGQVFVQLLTSEWRAIFQSQLNTEPEEVQRRLGPILTGMRS